MIETTKWLYIFDGTIVEWCALHFALVIFLLHKYIHNMDRPTRELHIYYFMLYTGYFHHRSVATYFLQSIYIHSKILFTTIGSPNAILNLHPQPPPIIVNGKWKCKNEMMLNYMCLSYIRINILVILHYYYYIVMCYIYV